MENPGFTMSALVVLSLLVGLLGKSRKTGFGWSFVLSLFLSPLVGLIITLCSKKKGVEFVDAKRKDC